MKASADILLEKSQSGNRSKKISSLIRNIALIIGIVAVCGMGWSIGIDSIIDNIRTMGWNLIWLLVIWLGVYILNALSWSCIIRDGETRSNGLTFGRILKYTISGYAINYATPMGLAGGEPYRIMELRPYLGTEKATSSVILYAMMHVVSHFIFWVSSAVLIVCFIPVAGWVMAVMLSIVAACLILIYFFFRGYRKGLVVKFFRILERIPYVRRYVYRMSPESRERLLIIDEQIKQLHAKRLLSFYGSLGLECLSRYVSCLEILFIIQILGGEISYVQSVIVVALSSLFANILFFSPMQLGTREGGYYLALKVLSLPAGLGISVSLITRIREVFWITVGILIIKVRTKVNGK